jgi:tight adherence protein B
MTPWIVAAALVAGAGVLAWPQRARRSTTEAWRGRIVAATGRIRAALDPGRHPARTVTAAAACAAGGAWWAAGPVAATIAGGYAALGVRALGRRLRTGRTATAHAAALDDLCGLAADLRAGLPPAAHWLGASRDPAPPALGGHPAAGRVEQLAAAVWHLAERTGAPAADLVERIEADARATYRARAAAAAQAAGARATAVLLAALPIGGIALGYGIGADPLAVLLHTPIGAACAVTALALQVAGLAWTDRLLGARR